MSGLANWQEWLWALNVCAQFAICLFLVHRRAYKQIPFFLFYLISDLTRSVIIFVSYQQYGFSSRVSYRVAWSAQAGVVLARGLTVAEVCKNCLRAYRGIWALGWRILAGVAGLVVSYSALATLAVREKAFGVTVTAAVMTADRGLEFALAAVLLSLLIFARYYGVALDRLHKSLAVGFCFYSCVSVLENTILKWWMARHATLWIGVEMFCYFLVLTGWLWAVYKLVPVPSAIPKMLSQNLYEELSPQFNYRLRLLNDRLIGVLKS